MTGEEWVVRKTGAYLPGAYEEVVEIVAAYVLTEKVTFKVISLNYLWIFTIYVYNFVRKTHD